MGLYFVFLCFSLVSSLPFVSWVSPRLVQVQEALYIDGGSPLTGDIFPNYTGDNYSYPVQPAGYLYKLNLTQSFNGTNSTDAIEYMFARDFNPDVTYYMDGALYGNDKGFYSYG